MAKKTLNKANQLQADAAARRRLEFLDCLRGDPATKRLPMSIRRACEAVGIDRITYRKWKADDAVFASACEDALEDGVDVIEDEAVRRAVQGVTEPVFYMGEVVGGKQVYSDSLLQTLLAGRRSAVYGKRPEIANQINVQLEQPSDRDVAKALALLIEEAKAQQEPV